VKAAKKSPDVLGNELGEELKKLNVVENYNVVKGFLNLSVDYSSFVQNFKQIKSQFDVKEDKNQTVMVEYSSPNTNKPLHLGHVRNNLLGYSVAEIIKASGKKVYKTQIINDRGIHICKSMLAWQKFGDGQTPESNGLKGDKLVGNFYVKFDQEYKAQIQELMAKGFSEEDAKKQAPIILEAQEMLRKWEAGDAEVVALWTKMNQWVYDGFAETYTNLGVDFDSYYYESNTYLLGKEVVQFGLEKGIFEKDPDGSVWIDLTAEGLDRKIVLRSDGTAVYMTQDIGTAIQRVKDYPDVGGMVYTVGNEQDYHFKVLFLILKKLGYAWANKLYHLSYAMVDLPSGKMKSREGTVVDADDLMDEVTAAAAEETSKLGKIEEFSSDELKQLYETLGFGALKYFILKVDPEKRMLFNPAESVEIHGNTGPYIQYVHARICSVLKRASQMAQLNDYRNMALESVVSMNDKERELAINILRFKETVETAAEKLSPAIVANYVYELAKSFNQFYHDNSIISEGELETSRFRLCLADACALTIKKSLNLLGIKAPERM